MFAKKSSILFGIFVVVIALSFLTTHPAHAAPIDKFPVTVTQPDGTVLNLFASGDEYYNWLQDAQGYTVIQDPVTGYYVYADLVSGKLVPTSFVAGRADPASVGLRPYLNISPEQVGQIRQAFLDQTKRAAGEIRNAPHTGTINNLVVFIRFSDESEFTNATSTYTNMLNDSTAGANSLRNYYREVSYNALTVDSHLYPTPGATVVSYQDSHPRGYYQPYSATNTIGYTGGDGGDDRRVREHTLLRDAINSVSSQIPSGLSIDGDGDGIVDGLTFIVSGDVTGWSSLLWPHQWSLYTYTVTINGKTVQNYSFHLNDFLTTEGTGVLAHEMFHALGAPDLYHYSSDGLAPVGGWDVMENTQNPPQHMGCYMKFTYGNWISSIQELSLPGTYTLNPLTSSTNNCYKIASPYSTTEYFVVEYRNGAGSTFEASLPGTGMLVYRINTLVTEGNRNGPPDEVYIYRPGGTTSVNGSVNSANFSSNVGRTAINDATNPSSFLSNGSAGGLNLCNIGASNATISFDICTGSGFAISGNAGVGGATLSYTDVTPKTATANGSGLYTFVVPSGWSGTVTPSKTDYTFTPPSRSYTNVLANQTAQDYTATGPTNLLQDPSFEASMGSTLYWAQASTNYGTPLCTVADCGTGAGTAGPQTGTVWGWFGGITSDETASLSQTVTIPSGTATLEFYLWIGSADAGSDAADVFTAKIDGATVFSANATQMSSYPSYTLVSVDVSTYANGAAHTVIFSSVTTGQVVNFNLDDVALQSETTPSGYTISGNAGVGGATLSYTDVTPKTAIADGGGLYSFTVPSGWSGTVTPSKTGYIFSPVYRSYTNILANQTGQNYTATPTNTYQIYLPLVLQNFPLPPPGAFAKSAPLNGAIAQPSNPTLSWGASSGATSYEYCINNSSNTTCDGTWTSKGTNTSVDLISLPPSTTFTWQVRANNASSGTTYADGGTWWTFTTAAAPLPGDFNKSAPANGAPGQPANPTLSWGASSNAASYEYCYDTTNNSGCDGSWISTGTNISAGLSGLTPATPYYWQVHAINASGTTEADGGAWWSFTTAAAPTGPTAGLWLGNVGFYVTPDQAYVKLFLIIINIPQCGGNIGIAYNQTPISNNGFSFSGSFSASGTFNSPTTASGTTRLDHYNIPNCGTVTGGPWSWNATWHDSSQPSSTQFGGMQLETIGPALKVTVVPPTVPVK